MMTLMEALRSRHSVRCYTPQPLDDAVRRMLEDEIAQCNAESGLHIQLVTDEPTAFKGLASYGKFSGVTHYLVMAAPKDKRADERVGYYGERLVLRARQWGLCSCWVGLTYRKVPRAFTLNEGERVACVIAIGYAEDKGVLHKLRSPETLAPDYAAAPQWYRQGVDAAQLAPSAVNQQKYRFALIGGDGPLPVVHIRRGRSLVGYTRMDMGIAKLHFEMGVNEGPWGARTFVWKEEH